jgi:hypothetical protein
VNSLSGINFNIKQTNHLELFSIIKIIFPEQISIKLGNDGIQLVTSDSFAVPISNLKVENNKILTINHATLQ